MTISPTDKGFRTEGCGTWTSDLSPITSSPTAPLVGGTYFVGSDIAPGTWRSSGGTGCYWARLSGFSGTSDDIIANDFTNTPLDRDHQEFGSRLRSNERLRLLDQDRVGP